MNTLKEIVETDLSTPLGNRTTNRRFGGVEYSGACPFGCGAKDAFHVYPDANDIPGVGTLGYYWCMDHKAGRYGCGHKGDGIAYLQEKRGLSFAEACQDLDIDAQKLIDYRRTQKGLPAAAPRLKEPVELKSLSEISEMWRKQALALARWASSQLAGEPLAYLRGRGFQELTIKHHVLGYYPTSKWVNARLWGANSGRMSIPRGIVIPWFNDDNEVICIRVRRLPDDTSQEARDHYGVDERTGEINRYKALYGSSSNYLYGGELLFPGCDAALFEGELDALISAQEAAQQPVSIVATGSTGLARSAMSQRKLSHCSQVLICYNADAPGDKASSYWLERLPRNSRRWRPLWSDANDMQQDGINVGEWLMIGLSAMDTLPVESEQAEPFMCSVCGIDLNNPELDAYYDESAISYCAEHWHRKKALDLIVPIFGSMRDVKVFRQGEYTLEQHGAHLEQQARDEEKLRRLSSYKHLVKAS